LKLTSNREATLLRVVHRVQKACRASPALAA
jgi:hypothetical protein